MPAMVHVLSRTQAKCVSESNLVTRRVNRFVSQLYHMLEDSSNNHVLRWNVSGSSFFIINVQEFISMLPKYFKGRTLGSFVRQLNMYNFHKVKGQKHRHVFRHPFFKKGDEESLKNIRRKHVGKEIRQKSSQCAEKELHPWNQVVADKLSKLRDVVDIMGRQNQDLVCINNRMVNELQQMKQSWHLKLKDLISLTANVVDKPESRLVGSLQAFMTSLGLDSSVPMLSSSDVLEFFIKPQGDQFKNQMNIFVVTEQLTSLYKQRNCKPFTSDMQVQKIGKGDAGHNVDSFTGGSTYNNASGFTPEVSCQKGGDRRCNSVDDISQFDLTDNYFSASELNFDGYCKARAEHMEFESFILDAFDSLSADHDYLFTERS